ncbi:glycine cleavage system aminomethyltransferase GcvT [Fimbriimonas ginsengisoli]|uniref:Aminomethyltransferase n=1 Tax=Fimbriimonas ginsengisoli Gsoil 348 TaxID=661478 RepID=A0A068NJ55_FIMGI|nr:glycine cleavage system aminomethyltransferase GcvT [Fimbriimonas ginsengisoli]AIE83623.1 glycine cleavage system T protein [Fimbriimonas ginsengisoli Gsoil 348]
MSDTLLRTPLYDKHVEAGGRMVPFAGYSMPVQYASIIAESKAVREGAGMFDVSHMARLTLRGDKVLQFLERVTSNDVAKLQDGAGQYSLLPNEQGGTVDDIIVYRISDTEFRMVVNADNHAKDVAWLRAHNEEGVEITDQTDETAMIAVQGPTAVETLAGISDVPDLLRTAPAFGIVEGRIGGVQCFSARSGYTGEDGYELICAASDATRLWDALLAAGVAACGLGARDTLRVEAGLPLYGHELRDDVSPIAAGLGWVISKTKSFIGSDPVNAARANGTPRKLLGVRLETKRLITPGMKVLVDGREVGEVTSGVVSPLLDRGIAFALIDSSLKPEVPCAIDVRGKQEPGTIVNKRFFVRKKA